MESEIVALGDLTRDQLADRWTTSHGRPPPPGVRRDLLCHAAAWHLQAKHLGGLSVEARKLLKKAMHRMKDKSNAGAGCAEGGLPLALSNQEARTGRSGGSDLAVDGGHDRADILDTGISRSHADNVRAGEGELVADASLAGRERKVPLVGSRLLRDWNGHTHVVDVTDTGFLFEGKTHRSLSSIARQITGAHWSGPRFFGL